MRERVSRFRNPESRARVEAWSARLREASPLSWRTFTCPTSWGDTWITASDTGGPEQPALVIVPGFRTCGLFWELGGGLQQIADHFRIYLLDVIGQPGLSSGRTPPLRGPGYGRWLTEVLDGLGLESAHLAGASFGGQLIFALAGAAPERILSATLMNPAALQPVDLLNRKLIWYNIRTFLAPDLYNARLFMERVIITPLHGLSPERMDWCVEFLQIALTGFRNGADYPYQLPDAAIAALRAPVCLILGSEDPLFPAARSEARARALLPGLREVHCMEGYSHGIEVAPTAIRHMGAFLLGLR
ncbi:MAG: alpha/beta fold hydrolase [Bacteroidia bacterium]|nr:alpha/beta fold hydrolase [Bacteroidia bacterium]